MISIKIRLLNPCLIKLSQINYILIWANKAKLCVCHHLQDSLIVVSVRVCVCVFVSLHFTRKLLNFAHVADMKILLSPGFCLINCIFLCPYAIKKLQQILHSFNCFFWNRLHNNNLILANEKFHFMVIICKIRAFGLQIFNNK